MKARITRKRARDELARYADRVRPEDVASTVGNAGKFKLLFRSVEALVEYKDDIALIFSMLRDITTRRYRKCPWRTISVLVGALGYVLTTFDLIPDFMPVIGWSDDCLALAAALAFAKRDLDEYRVWKVGRSAAGKGGGAAG